MSVERFLAWPLAIDGKTEIAGTFSPPCCLVFVGQDRQSWVPGPLLRRSFSSVQMFHTHTHPARRGFFRKNAKLSKRSESKADTARYIHIGQAALLSSRRAIAR